jgi:hypothetical protein
VSEAIGKKIGGGIDRGNRKETKQRKNRLKKIEEKNCEENKFNIFISTSQNHCSCKRTNLLSVTIRVLKKFTPYFASTLNEAYLKIKRNVFLRVKFAKMRDQCA